MKVFFILFILFADGQTVHTATEVPSMEACREQLVRAQTHASATRDILGAHTHCVAIDGRSSPT